MIKNAIFSPCGLYRYVLQRAWDEDRPHAVCIGLNPSTANEHKNDKTIDNLIALLDNNGFGGLAMMNLFALVSPHPEDLRTTPDPLKENDWYFDKVNTDSTVIFAWGNFKQAEYRAKKMVAKFPSAYCFGKNANGSPKHPLYLSRQTKLIKFK